MKYDYSRILLLLGLCFPYFDLPAQPIIDIQDFALNVSRPTDITHAGDTRIFVASQDGNIYVLDSLGNIITDTFLDLRGKISTGGERGLLGLAFHPNYQENGFFYVNYTNPSGDTRITRFQVSSENPNQALADSEKFILGFDQPFSNHNGGDIVFGSDGYLYIASGDGGAGNDPQNHSQRGDDLLGKILRINVDEGDPYSIPADNPFVDDPNVVDEIWVLGLRNPWRISFDRLTQDLWVGDVGQHAKEEIDFLPAGTQGGENFGWRCYEGSILTPTANTNGCPPQSSFIGPVFDYNTSELGCSVTGGFVYRGAEFPLMYGHYVFADWCTGRFWTLFQDSTGTFSSQIQKRFSNGQYSTFGENNQGELFVGALGQNKVLRVVDICSPLIPELTLSEDTLFSTAADRYQWYRNGELLSNATQQQITVKSPGVYSVEVNYDNGCTIRSAPIELTTTSLNKTVEIGPISLIPNPTTNRSLLQFDNPTHSPYHLRIQDIQGRIVQEVLQLREDQYEVDGSSLPAGVYLITLEGEKQFRGKWVIGE